VHVESELRAFGNPTRMAMIERAAQDLVQKINQACPECDGPGYQVVSHRKGLPCAACGQPTRMPTHALWRCAHCQHSQEVVLAQARNADPSRCDHCNP
jgi:ribosomal protein S27AE